LFDGGNNLFHRVPFALHTDLLCWLNSAKSHIKCGSIYWGTVRDEFAAEERFDLTLAHRALFQKLEGQYFLYRYEFLEKDLWNKRGAWAASLIALPFFKEWWRQEKQQHVYTDEFVSAIESIEAFDMRAAGYDDGAA